ncbi:hypothetical protein GIB67_038068, partial [Kingdonia uniflora]
MGIIRTHEEPGRHVRMLTHEIISTLDRQTILKTTLVELGRTLTLEECALWIPTRTGLELQLSYILRHQNPVGFTISIQLPVINQVFSSNRAIKISPNSPVARLRPLVGKYIHGEVAVALSHATILEECMRARDHLAEQNVALDLARREPETTISPDLPVYVVDGEKLLIQTILNVADNAVKFSKEGSIYVYVKDSGSGISPQDIPKLFNKFADSQSLASKNSCGKGLGLAISKRFLSLMEGLQVLVMDGNGVSMMATKGLLVHLGCDVTAVGSSEECLWIFSHEHKVVFTDVGISGMDGYKVVSVLQDRFLARNQWPLITTLTTNTDRATKDNCLRVGMDGVVPKPVSLEKMRSVLSVLLQNGTLRKT